MDAQKLSNISVFNKRFKTIKTIMQNIKEVFITLLYSFDALTFTLILTSDHEQSNKHSFYVQ